MGPRTHTMSQSAYEHLDLAHVEPFTLGALQVEPALRLVRNDETSEIIEPRVMQLLVALTSARGNVLSRDDLMQLCWGMVVGENAIQRTVSHLRKIASTIAGGSFEVETVRGVGYRLVETRQRGPRTSRQSMPQLATLFTRRNTLAATAVAAAAVAAPIVLARHGEARASETAQRLYERAEITLREEAAESGRDAGALLQQAVTDSPLFAKAWGALAIAYWQSLIGVEGSQADYFAALSRSAATRALAIDSNLPEARGALAILESDFRHWNDAKRSLQAVPGSRSSWAVLRWLGFVGSNLGDFSFAIDHLRRALAVEPLLPRVSRDLAVSYWGAGLPVEAERTLSEAIRLWPANYGLWEFQFRYLALTGNYQEAAQCVTDEASLPIGLSSIAVEKRLALIDALQGKGRRDGVIRIYLDETRQHPLNTTRVAEVLAALDAREELYEILEGFFLTRGPFGVPIARYALRPTFFLFLPPLLKFHAEPRFARIMRAIGLNPRA